MNLTVAVPPRGDAPYEIKIEEGILQSAGKEVRAALPNAKRAVVVSDSNVAPLYLQTVCASLEGAGFETASTVFPAGEASKRLSTIETFYEAFSNAHLTRTDCAVALGGGVCGDMAGFAAATWLRGMPFVQIPTTLLAQVDSSVGGKTGVDLPSGKNLVGAFHQPALVLIDPETLKTLPGRFFEDGMGEVLKYGCIRDAAFFDRLLREDCRGYLAETIYTCVDWKRKIVEEDPLNTGVRDVLNFGHTFAHAIEAVEHYTGLTHGTAVGVGMVLISRLGESLGLTEPGTAEKIAQGLAKYGLPTACGEPLPALLTAASHDKKNVGANIRLIFLRRIGEGLIHEMPFADFRKACGVLA